MLPLMMPRPVCPDDVCSSLKQFITVHIDGYIVLLLFREPACVDMWPLSVTAHSRMVVFTQQFVYGIHNVCLPKAPVSTCLTNIQKRRVRAGNQIQIPFWYINNVALNACSESCLLTLQSIKGFIISIMVIFWGKVLACVQTTFTMWEVWLLW